VKDENVIGTKMIKCRVQNGVNMSKTDVDIVTPPYGSLEGYLVYCVLCFCLFVCLYGY